MVSLLLFSREIWTSAYTGKPQVKIFVVVKMQFVFSKKATKIGEIFTVDLTVYSKCQIDSEDFVKFCSLLEKHELYL